MPLTGCVAGDQITNTYTQNTELLGNLNIELTVVLP